MKFKIQTLYVRAPSRYKEGTKDMEAIRKLAELICKTDQESVWVLSLNNKRLAVSLDLIALGGIGTCDLDVKILFRRVLATGAYGFTLIHTHPGDTAYQSENDKKAMKQIRFAAQAIELYYFDDIVIDVNEIYSTMWDKKYKIKKGK